MHTIALSAHHWLRYTVCTVFSFHIIHRNFLLHTALLSNDTECALRCKSYAFTYMKRSLIHTHTPSTHDKHPPCVNQMIILCNLCAFTNLLRLLWKLCVLVVLRLRNETTFPQLKMYIYQLKKRNTENWRTRSQLKWIRNIIIY